MIKAKLDPIAFSHIMYRLENQDASNKESEDKAPLTDLEKVGDYLSTHPNTVDRMENAKRYSEIYKKQLAQ
jgi:predicted Zn-dependent protease